MKKIIRIKILSFSQKISFKIKIMIVMEIRFLFLSIAAISSQAKQLTNKILNILLLNKDKVLLIILIMHVKNMLARLQASMYLIL
jgi:hypothetical protein